MINVAERLPRAQQRRSPVQNPRFVTAVAAAEEKIALCDLSSLLEGKKIKKYFAQAKDSYERTTITHHYEM